MSSSTSPAEVAEHDTPAARSIAAGDNRSFVGHPAGLGSLFGVEMLERFSFYGMKAILLYYLYYAVTEGGLAIAKPTAAVIVATYGAAVYLLSVVGGWFADRVVGAWRSTLYGGIVIMAGHISLSIPGGVGLTWLGLCLIALGTGLLKPNISTMVGSLYTENDPRRDGGFEIFYMSINIGGFLSPIVVAALKNRWGFHAGFAAAAVGMALALAVYVLFSRSLHGAGREIPNPLTEAEKKRLPLMCLGLAAVVAVLWFVAGFMAKAQGGEMPEQVSWIVFLIAVIASVYYFWAMHSHPKTTETDKRHIMAYLPLYVGACLFWMVFEQASGLMAQFADQNTQLMIGSFRIDPEWYQSVNSVFIILLAPLFGWVFTRRAGRFPSTPVKFATAVGIIGFSALMMSWMFATWPGGSRLAPFWLLGLVFVIQTIGELMLSPVGLSATTQLAPKHFASQVMGLWFLTSAVGQGLAAIIIGFTANASPAMSYLINGVMTLAITLVLFALVPWTRRQMQDVEEAKRKAHDESRGVYEATTVHDA